MSQIQKFIEKNNFPTLPDNAQWKNRFEIKSESSNRVYTIAQRKTDDTWGCSCPGWRTKRRCKHLNSISDAIKNLK